MEKLIYKLKQNKVKVNVVNNNLELNFPKDFAADDILNEVRKNKQELTAYIKKMTKGATSFKAIEPGTAKDYYVLSSSQKRLYFLYEFDVKSMAYNMPQLVRLEGSIDKSRLRNAFNRLILRHESLRTSFAVVDEEPVQKIAESIDFELEQFDVPESEVEQVLKKFIRPFDLSQAPLIRVGLIKLSDMEHILMVDMHHIITDGVSDGILVNDFMALYKDEVLPDLYLQYRDYAEWQQSEEQQAEMEKQKDFWLNLFAEDTTTIDLPTDFKRPVIKSHEGSSVGFGLDLEKTSKLRLITEQSGSTMFMTILSIYYILLSKLTNQEDIVIGTPVAGRQHADLENIIGMFVNTLPLRNHPKGNMSFKEFLATVKSDTLACLDNQAYQYEALLDELKVERDTSRNPLFEVMFSYQNFEESELSMPDLRLSSYNSSHSVSKFDISLTAAENDEQIFLTFEYSTELFKRETIDRFITYFQKIVATVVEDIDKKIGEIEILSNREKHQLLKEFNTTESEYPKHETILSLFEIQVGRTPENIALRYDNKTITYQELNEKACSLGSYLRRSKRVEVGDLVGIMLEREEYLIPSIFGILKSGCAYVPIDPNLPAERINSIVKNSKIKVLLTRGKHLKASMKLATEIVDLDNAMEDISNSKALESEVKVCRSDLAYVIYTSGSTGTPKGVMIEHRSLLNIIQCMDARYPLKETDSYLLKTTYSFDVSVAEIFGWFHAGGSLTLLRSGAEGDPARILETIERAKVSHINFVPSMFSVFIEGVKKGGLNKINSLKYIFLAGEALPKELVKKFHSLNTGIVLENIYGPTEATIYSCGYSTKEIKDSLKVPIGKPLSNIKLYVVDHSNNIQPIGVPGELCIGGEALARGYLHNEALTTEKFIHMADLHGERIYKTGDLVRWLSDGNIEYLGRIDNQVKIRGFRIELGEIESQLHTNAKIEQSVVQVKEKEEDKYLVAYYVSEQEIDTTELRSYLSNKLPEYMLPTYYVHLESLPLTPNGKLDRKALPDPEIKIGEDYEPPSNEMEEKLVQIWSEVLKVDKARISINRSFFELGGHSLKAMVLVNKLYKVFNVEVSLREIFNNATIKSMTKNLEVQFWLNNENDKQVDAETNKIII
jgi:amino acid adenylation domain-containing protein